MKKLLILLLAATLVISATGCGLKRKIEDKIGEAIGEKVLDSVTDGKVNVEGDKITIKGEDGTEVTMGGTEWPKNDLIKDIPKFDKGTIVNVTESEAAVLIMFEGVEKKDFESYYEKIQEEFTEEPFNMEIDQVISYGAKDGKGIYAQVTFNNNDGTLNISVNKPEE